MKPRMNLVSQFRKLGPQQSKTFYRRMAHATQVMRPPSSLKLKERALIQMSKRRFFASATGQADQECSGNSNTSQTDNEYSKTHHAHFHKILVFLS